MQDTGIESFPVLYDSTFQAWQELEIAGQPQGRLLTAGGEIIAGWAGGIPVDEVLAAVAEL